MDMPVLTLIAIVAAIALILMGIPVAYALLSCAVFAMFFGLGPLSLMKLGVAPFSSFYSLSWTTLPLFLLLAMVINETTIASDIFNAAQKWFSRIRGGLVVSSIVAQAIMAAAIGASEVTILSVGTVALPEMERLKYNKRLSMGALLAAGVLGPLIPPSIPLVIYAILSETSISRLLIAGIVPGLILVVILSAYVMFACRRHPDWSPAPVSVRWGERVGSLKKVWPIVAVLVSIIGAIYAGIATASEAAGVGVVVAIFIAVAFYKFRFKHVVGAMSSTATMIGMIGLLIISGTVFSFAVGSSGLARDVAEIVIDMGLSPWMVIIAINVILLILGCIMDTLAITLVTVPIFVPMITALGFDPIWFGVVMVINTEIGLLTPPIGMNLFVTSQVFKVPFSELVRSIGPFLIIMFIFLALIIAFPELSLWLPGLMK